MFRVDPGEDRATTELLEFAQRESPKDWGRLIYCLVTRRY